MWDKEWESDFEKAWAKLNSYEEYTKAAKHAELQRLYTVRDYDLAWMRRIINDQHAWAE